MLKTKKSRYIALVLGILFIAFCAMEFIWVIPVANQNRYYAQVQLYLDNPPSAEASLKTNPDDAAANEALGQIYLRGNRGRDRDYVEAAKYFRETVRIQPENGSTWLSLAICLKKIGQTAEATQIVQKLAKDEENGKTARKLLAKWQSEPTP